MKVNGKDLYLEQNQSLYDYLQQNNYEISKIAVERNGEIVPRSIYAEVILKDEDTLEIVRFVGGG